MRIFTWKTWEPWGNLYNTTLGTLTTFTWETWESWGNLYNATSEKVWGNLDNIYNLGTLENLYNVTLGTLREPLQCNLGKLEETLTRQYNLGTLENLLQCNLGNLEGTFTIQPWEPWKTWEPSGNLEETLKEPWGYLLGTLREPWQSNLGNLLETFTMSPWEPGPRLLGNLYIIILGTLTTFTWKTWDPCREPWRNLEGTFWEPWGNLEEPWEPWEPWANLGNLGNLERTLSEPWEPWEPLLGNLGNLYLGTWEPLLGNLGTFTWEPLLGNLYLEPGNLEGMGFGAAPVCSETFTMAEDPKAFCCWGKRDINKDRWPSENDIKMHRCYDSFCAFFNDQFTIDLRSICDQFASKRLMVST